MVDPAATFTLTTAPVPNSAAALVVYNATLAATSVLTASTEYNVYPCITNVSVAPADMIAVVVVSAVRALSVLPAGPVGPVTVDAAPLTPVGPV